MTLQGWFTLAVVAGTIAVLVRDKLSPAATILGANILLLLTGVINAQQALSGFSNPALMTVAALFVLARAVGKTGALQPLLRTTLGAGGTRPTLARLLLPVAGASAFLNNTPIVAMLAPQVAAWAEKRGMSASSFLMPLSFATILGGTITVIGTSTNLVVSGLMQDHGMTPIGMFELARIGLPLTVGGVLFMIAAAPLCLPERRTARQQFVENPREYVCQGTVVAGGPLHGMSVEAARLRNLEGIFLVQMERAGEVIAPVAPEMVLRGGDVLTFAGRVGLMRDIQSIRGLEPEGRKHALRLTGPTHTFFEAVVSSASSLDGRTLKEVDFRNRYQAAVVAVHRAGRRVDGKLGTVKLKEGDTLLLLSDHGFRSRWHDRPDFLLVSHLGGTIAPSTRQAILVAVLTFGLVAVAGLGLVPILNAALAAAVLLVLARVLTPSEARWAVELDVLVVIGAAFGLGAAIEASGLAATAAQLIVGAFQGLGPVGVLLAITLATVTITEVISNNAAVVLIFPIAVATAAQLGLDPRPFAIAITVAGSASFLTPIGYQTNTMVYGLGGYRFTDYIRLGLPLSIVVVTLIVLLVPVYWPLVR